MHRKARTNHTKRARLETRWPGPTAPCTLATHSLWTASRGPNYRVANCRVLLQAWQIVPRQGPWPPRRAFGPQSMVRRLGWSTRPRPQRLQLATSTHAPRPQRAAPEPRRARRQPALRPPALGPRRGRGRRPAPAPRPRRAEGRPCGWQRRWRRRRPLPHTLRLRGLRARFALPPASGSRHPPSATLELPPPCQRPSPPRSTPRRQESCLRR